MSKPCFQLKGGLFTLTALYILSNDLKHFEDTLHKKIIESPNFFKNLPIIIDLSQLPDDIDSLDFGWLKNLLMAQGIIPVALHNVPQRLLQKATQSDWGIFPNIQPRQSKNIEAINDKEIETKEEPISEIKADSANVKIVTTHIRSGQQVYYPGSDLIIINTVNTGAEVLSDGNIHIYGALRGRALAGIKGNQFARIFCQSLEAEIISIAGKYRILESIADKWRGKSVQIYLENEELKIEQFNKEF